MASSSRSSSRSLSSSGSETASVLGSETASVSGSETASVSGSEESTNPTVQISLGKIYLDIGSLEPNKYTYFDKNKDEKDIKNLLDTTDLPTDILLIDLNTFMNRKGFDDEQCEREKKFLLDAIEKNSENIKKALGSTPVVSSESNDIGYYEIG